MFDLSEVIQSPDFAQGARHPDFLQAFTRARKLPLPGLIAALLSQRGQLHMPAVTALNNLLVRRADEVGLVPRWYGLRAVAADGSVLVPAVRASHLARAAAPDQRVLGLLLLGAGMG